MLLEKKIASHTVPIFRRVNNEIKIHGTGVLVKYENQHYLVSAAHVLEREIIEEILIYTGNDELMGLGSHKRVTTSIPEAKKRKDDKLDFGFIQFHNTPMDYI